MSKRLTLAILIVMSLVFPASSALALTKVSVPSGKSGVGVDTIVVAEKGSVVVVRKGANVQYWPGSNLVHISNASEIPSCSDASIKVDNNEKELWVSSGASACASGDTAVVALEGSTVIYEDDVPLIRRPVVPR